MNYSNATLLVLLIVDISYSRANAQNMMGKVMIVVLNLHATLYTIPSDGHPSKAATVLNLILSAIWH